MEAYQKRIADALKKHFGANKQIVVAPAPESETDTNFIRCHKLERYAIGALLGENEIHGPVMENILTRVEQVYINTVEAHSKCTIVYVQVPTTRKQPCELGNCDNVRFTLYC